MHEKKESKIVPSKSKNLVIESDEINDFIIEISNSCKDFNIKKEGDKQNLTNENFDIFNQDNKDNFIGENYNKDRLYLENEQNKQIDMLLTKFSTVNNNEYINENEMIIFVGKNISKVIGKI